MCITTFIHTNINTNTTHTHTGRQADSQPDRQPGRQADIPTYIHRYRHTHTYIHIHIPARSKSLLIKNSEFRFYDISSISTFRGLITEVLKIKSTIFQNLRDLDSLCGILAGNP